MPPIGGPIVGCVEAAVGSALFFFMPGDEARDRSLSKS
jgi:hypothetical protein